LTGSTASAYNAFNRPARVGTQTMLQQSSMEKPPQGLPQGYRDIPLEDRKKAKAFFDRGSTVAGTGNYDYAIEMYIQGLTLDPESVEGHQALRDIAMRRKASGGKALGMLQAMKLKAARTKDDKDAMLNSERLLAHDPGNTDHMVNLMQNAQKGGFYDTVMWIGPILLKANIDGKSETKKSLALRDTYIALRQWRKATEACQYALAARPNDMDLQREVKDLSARQTMSEGNYESAGDFRGSIRDREGQEKLMRQDSDVRTEDQMSILIREAESEWRNDPEEPGKLMKYIDVLVKTENPEHENRAIEVLEQAYQRTHQFRFRLRVGEIRMRQLSRLERSLRERAHKNPSDKSLREEYLQFKREKAEEELREFTLAAENYPTQLDYQFHMARRLFELDRFGEAIPVFQNSRRDPKFKNEGTIMLGRSFLEAGFVDEAVDTLKGLIDEYQLKGD